MVNFASIQQKIDRGKGKAAQKLGEPWSAFRLTATSTGDYPDAWVNVADDYPIFTRRLKSEKDIQVAISNAALFYDIIGDMTPFILGDVMVKTDPPYDPGVSYGLGATKVDGLQINAFGLAWHPPVAKAIGGRIDRRCKIYRPAVAPSRNLGDGSKLWRSTYDGDQPLVLFKGNYSLGSAGGGASYVPCGFTVAYRPYGQKPFEVAGSPPGMVRPTHWFAYLPPLPGYSPREGDTLITEDGARYIVVQPFYQTAGVVGSQLMLDRTSAEDT